MRLFCDCQHITWLEIPELLDNYMHCYQHIKGISLWERINVLSVEPHRADMYVKGLVQPTRLK